MDEIPNERGWPTESEPVTVEMIEQIIEAAGGLTAFYQAAYARFQFSGRLNDKVQPLNRARAWSIIVRFLTAQKEHLLDHGGDLNTNLDIATVIHEECDRALKAFRAAIDAAEKEPK